VAAPAGEIRFSMFSDGCRERPAGRAWGPRAGAL